MYAQDDVTEILQYVLYDASTDWDLFITYKETSTNNPTTNEISNATAYKSYALQIICDLSSLSLTSIDGAGCCLMDYENENGGYCVLYSSTTSTV